MDRKAGSMDSIVKYWRDSSDKDHLTMHHLLVSKDYHWSLFLGHLVLEKLLKAIFVKKHNQHAPFTHDLLRLSEKIEIQLSEEQSEWLDEISAFNLNARYDNYKQDFYKLCTKDFSTLWIERIENLRTWLIQQF